MPVRGLESDILCPAHQKCLDISDEIHDMILMDGLWDEKNRLGPFSAYGNLAMFGEKAHSFVNSGAVTELNLILEH